MSTRSLTHIHKQGFDSPIVATIYRQGDGYPTGMGADILETLGQRELVNGYTDEKKQTNGMSCAAALLVSAIKGDDAGNVYLYEPGASDCWEEYTYSLAKVDDTFHLKLTGHGEVLFDGKLADFDPAKVEEMEYADDDADEVSA